jgi:pimeloyl-ACP methyl ester carboxylesterase
MRLIHLAVALLALPLASARAAEVDLVLDGDRSGLHGTLLTSDAPPAQARPAVLLIAGSGPTDRNGDSTQPGVRPASLRLLAEALQKAGYASLRFDKRGIAASHAAMTAEKDLTFDLLIDDAVAWAKRLAREPGVSCVVLVGHSEGAEIAAFAAQKTKVCGVISISGAGRKPQTVILDQLKAAGLPEAVMANVRVVISELEAGRTVPGVPPTDPLFRPSVQPYLISWFAKDPAAGLGAVQAPVLILQGTTDLQVSTDDARLLAAAQPKAKMLLLQGVNHVLKTAPQDRAANIAAYADARPLDPQVAPAILNFLQGVKP